MQRTRQPCRQLNSEGIKSAALCYLLPVISGRCSIISAKCIFKVKDKDLGRAWTSICSKRDSCDNAISGQYLLEYLKVCFRRNLENILSIKNEIERI